MTESEDRRELLALGSPLPILAAFALVVLAVTAALTLHPVIGGAIVAAGFGGAWIVTSRRRHDLERERVKAEAHARARQPFAPPRPVDSPSPSPSVVDGTVARRSPFEGV